MISRDFLWRLISAGVFLGGGRGCDYPLRVQGKALMGTRQQSLRKLQGFSIYSEISYFWYTLIPFTTSDETNLTYSFSKILPKVEFKVNFSIQSSIFLAHEEPAYLQLTYHLSITFQLLITQDQIQFQKQNSSCCHRSDARSHLEYWVVLSA